VEVERAETRQSELEGKLSEAAARLSDPSSGVDPGRLAQLQQALDQAREQVATARKQVNELEPFRQAAAEVQPLRRALHKARETAARVPELEQQLARAREALARAREREAPEEDVGGVATARTLPGVVAQTPGVDIRESPSTLQGIGAGTTPRGEGEDLQALRKELEGARGAQFRVLELERKLEQAARRLRAAGNLEDRNHELGETIKEARRQLKQLEIEKRTLKEQLRATGQGRGDRRATPGSALAEVVQLKEDISRLRGELEGARRDVAQADALNRSLREQVHQLKAEAGAATVRHGTLPTAGEERRDTTRMASPETTYLKQEVTAALTKAKAAEQALARIKRERDALAIRVNALELHGAPTRVEKRPLELLDPSLLEAGEFGELSVHERHTRDNLMQGALGELEKLRAELDSVQEQREDLKRQVEVLTSENVSLRSINQLHTSPTGEFTSISEALEVKGDVMERVVDALMARKEVRGVALADPIGLPVVEKGSFTEEIAAVAAHITKVSNKTIRLLPFGVLRSIALQDENALTVSIHPFITMEKSQLILATLSTGSQLSRQDLEAVIASAESEG